MRSFRHWTPHYLLDRTLEKFYRATHPDLPWLSPQANQFLEHFLSKEMRGVEFGSGRSTLFFARHVHHLVSIEHNPIWFEKVSGWLKEKQCSNVDYFLYPRVEGESPASSKYVMAVQAVHTESLDFALIDGIYRDNCTRMILSKIKPGGILIIDNVNRYLPGKTHSPNSIHINQPPASPLWAEVFQVLSSWRCEWTSNGISDTAIFIKPGG